VTSKIERLFTNREDEIKLFMQMVRREIPQRVLAIQAPGGIGKSWLIDRYEAWCKHEHVPCARLDFDAAREGGPLSPEIILEKAGEAMGLMPASDLEAFARLLREMTGSPARVDVGSGAVISSAQFGDIANLIIKELHLPPSNVDPPTRRHQATRRFRQALAACGPAPAVWLVDTCERAEQNPDTADWLCGAIMHHVACDDNMPLVIVLAGQSLPPIKEEWKDCVLPLKLEPFKVQQVIWLIREGFKLAWDEPIVQVVHSGTGGVPQAVVAFVEQYIATQEVLR
jgi:hypothetical protein